MVVVGILPGRAKRKRRAPGKMPDAAAKRAALPAEDRLSELIDLRYNAQPYLHLSEMRPLHGRAIVH